MNIANGHWFNGTTSKPLDIELFLDETEQVLVLNHQQHIVKWNFSDLKIQSAINSVHIYNTKWPAESVFTDNNLLGREITRFTSNKGDQWYFRLLHSGIKVHLIISAGILLIAVALYFLFVPWLSERAVTLIPVEYDKELGALAFDDFIKDEESDSVLTVLLQSFYNEMKVETTVSIHTTVVTSSQVNAFALPDGNIVVFSEILKSMDNYTELAGLLSHEAAHIKNRHSMKMLSRSLSVYFVLSIILSDVNGLMTVMAQNADQLNMLSYSRRFEEEADAVGWQIMKHNRLDPEGMIMLFEKLEKENGSLQIPELISTHPLTKERIKSIKSLIKNNPYSYSDNEKLKLIFSDMKKQILKTKRNKKAGI